MRAGVPNKASGGGVPSEAFMCLVFLCVRRSLLSYLSKFYYYDPEEEMYLSIKSIRAALRAHT